MPDTPEVQQAKEVKAATIKTNEKLDKLDSTIKEQTQVLKGNTPDKPDVEGKKEEKARGAEVLKTLKGLLKATGAGITKGSGGLLDGVKKMFSKYKKIIMGLIGVGIIGFLSQLNMKQLKELWVAFSDALKEIYKTLKPIIVGLGEWAKDTAFPATFEAIKKQFEHVKEMFAGIGEHLKGWEDKSWAERFESIVGVMDTIGTYFWNTALNMMDWGWKLLGGEGSLSKKMKKKWDELFGGEDDGGEGAKGSNFMSMLGSIARGFVGMFVVGKLLPLGWMSTALMKPLQLAITGAGKVLGFAGHLGKGLIKAMPAMGKGTAFAGRILGSIASKAGIIGLAYAVGAGVYDAYKVAEAGGSVQESFDAGISKFLQIVSLSILSKKRADQWAHNITNFFGDIYDAMFGDKEKVMTKKEIQQERELRSGKKWVQMTQEQRNAAAAELRRKQDLKRLGGKSSEIALKKKDTVGLAEQKAAIDREMEGISQVQLAKKGAQDWTKWSELEKQSIAIQKKIAKIEEEKLTNFKKSDLVNMSKGNTRESSWTGQSDDVKRKMNVMGGLFKGGVRITSGWRSEESGNKAMLNRKDPLSGYKGAIEAGLTPAELNAKAGTKERESGIAKLRAGGFMSQHEHGNAIDFSYPTGYSKENFGALKTTLLNTFPGANLLQESDHLHMAFNKATTGIQLAKLEQTSAGLRGGVGGTGSNTNTQVTVGGSTTQNYTVGNAVRDETHVQEELVGIPT